MGNDAIAFFSSTASANVFIAKESESRMSPLHAVLVLGTERDTETGFPGSRLLLMILLQGEHPLCSQLRRAPENDMAQRPENPGAQGLMQKQAFHTRQRGTVHGCQLISDESVVLLVAHDDSSEPESHETIKASSQQDKL